MLGFRQHGERKQKLLKKFEKIAVRLQKSGISAKDVFRYYEINKRNMYRKTTKQITGMISELEQFCQANKV